jgi:hypothetical protein
MGFALGFVLGFHRGFNVILGRVFIIAPMMFEIITNVLRGSQTL